MTPLVLLGMLLIGYTSISLIAFKLTKETGLVIWIKLILSISAGWLLAYLLTGSLFYLRWEIQIQIQEQSMNLTMYVSFIAFVCFQMLLYNLFDIKGKKRE
ncbi:hypothetical protein [Texcoconibacillus texcoconensis]|uniref:Uncharacterized protein n=1 Tax=Texcoconibacillus texcoconensis TaxID=1095777 RepID=A0A840QKR3_9BACI|nr:hypothetical protein [Texcoconibacillus texcoconensis]MBB5171983.1 hypothetical protein [Texcoconibacillus texcoconensis]